MAKYHRDFLVPYISNICALHIAKAKIEATIDDLQETLLDFQTDVQVTRPKKGEEESIGCGGIGAILLGCFMFFGCLLAWLTGNADGMGFTCFAGLVVGAGFLYFGIASALEVKKFNDLVREEYASDLKCYEEQCKLARQINEEQKLKIPQVKEWIAFYEDECAKVTGLINKAYEVNVLPLRYRDRYTAFYLYDWFVYGSSNDLDMALNTYVLEEIKERLDVVIRNQSDMILNQQRMIANQYNSLELQKEYGSKMIRKLDNIQATEEEHLCYTQMIQSDTEAIKYFVAAEYFKDL